MISVIIIIKNEEKNLARCLQSVSWADEIVLLDSGSQDKSLEIASAFGCKIHKTDWPGFGPQKQRALELAQGSWVFSIDADEVVSAELKQEILNFVADNKYDAAFMPRLSYLCGEAIYHSGWYPDFILRLFKKEKAQFSKDLVHEKVLCQGTSSKLKNHLLHYSYDNFEQFIQKFNQYSSLGAKNLYDKNKKSSIGKAFFRGLHSFIKHYFFKLGFLDGGNGLVVAISAFESTYYKYLKLHLLQKNAKPKKT